MSTTRHPSGAPWRNFYGRFKGKTLRDAQKDYLDQDLAALSPGPVGWDLNPDRIKLDPGKILGGRPLWLEIGFGGGEHLLHLAEINPGTGIIGCEPFINGVAMLLGKIRGAAADNIAVHPGDVRDLFDVLPDGALGRAYLLYPDPWPKARHHRRRFVTAEFLAPLSRVLAPGALFHVATDIEDYVRQTLIEVPRHGFDWLAERPGDWREPWAGWTPTRYENKSLREGRRPHYMVFQRTGGRG